MSNYSSFWRVECRRVSSCPTDRRESFIRGRASSWPEASRGLRGTVQQKNCRGGSADFLAQTLSARGRVKRPFVRVRSSKKEVWTMSTLSGPDCLLQPPD